jgi:hypothetical protein
MVGVQTFSLTWYYFSGDQESPLQHLRELLSIIKDIYMNKNCLKGVYRKS